MTTHPIFLFDGSFIGFLTAVQTGLLKSMTEIQCATPEESNAPELFGPQVKIQTNTFLAKQLWGDLGLMGTEVQKRVYYSFLHKNTILRSVIYKYMSGLLTCETAPVPVTSGIAVSQLAISTREVDRERGLLEKHLEFRKGADGLWFAEIQPKHNILPLLSRFCRSRFQNSPWTVTDTQRRQTLTSLSGKLTLSSYTSANAEHLRLETVPAAHPLFRRTPLVLTGGVSATTGRATNSNEPSFQSRDSKSAWASNWGQRAV
jgi:probable DNA metabolism protein